MRSRNVWKQASAQALRSALVDRDRQFTSRALGAVLDPVILVSFPATG